MKYYDIVIHRAGRDEVATRVTFDKVSDHVSQTTAWKDLEVGEIWQTSEHDEEFWPVTITCVEDTEYFGVGVELPGELPPTQESVDLSLTKTAQRQERLAKTWWPTINGVRVYLEFMSLATFDEDLRLRGVPVYVISKMTYREGERSRSLIGEPARRGFQHYDDALAEYCLWGSQLQAELGEPTYSEVPRGAAIVAVENPEAQLPETLPPTNESLDLSLVKHARTLKNVGVFAKLPEELAKQFPSLGDEDPSPPHVTVLYIGDLPEEKYDAFLGTVKMVCGEIAKPFKAKLDGLDKFDHNDKGQRVWFVKIESEGLHHLHNLLEKECEHISIVSHSDHKEYVPHATLEYQDEPGAYTGKVPTGEWEVKEVEVWKGEGEGPVVKVASVVFKRAQHNFPEEHQFPEEPEEEPEGEKLYDVALDFEQQGHIRHVDYETLALYDIEALWPSVVDRVAIERLYIGEKYENSLGIALDTITVTCIYDPKLSVPRDPPVEMPPELPPTQASKTLPLRCLYCKEIYGTKKGFPDELPEGTVSHGVCNKPECQALAREGLPPTQAAQDGYDPQVLEAVVADVARAKQGDSEAKERLVERFSPMMWSIVHKAPIRPQDWNDAYQELYTAFDRAIKGYNSKTGVPFYAYLQTALENEALRHAERYSRPREREISLDLPVVGEEGEETTLGDTLMSTTIPPDIYAQVRDIYNKVHDELAGRDRYVFEQLTAKGLSPVEIVQREQWGRYDPLSLPGLRRVIRDHILPVVKKYKQLYTSGSVQKQALNEEAQQAVEAALEKDKTAQSYLLLDSALGFGGGYLEALYMGGEDIPRRSIPSLIRKAVTFIEMWAPFSAESVKPVLEGYLATRSVDEWQQLDQQYKSLRWPLQQEIYENYFHVHERPTRELKNKLTRKKRIVRTLESFDAFTAQGQYDEETISDAANELYEFGGDVRRAIQAVEKDIRDKELELTDPEFDQEDREDAQDTLQMDQRILPLLEAYRRYLGVPVSKGQLPVELPPTQASIDIIKVGTDGSRTKFTKVAQHMGALVNLAIRTFRANEDPLTREMMLDIIGKAITEHGDLLALEEQGVECLDIREVFLDSLAGGDARHPIEDSPLINKARQVIALALGIDVVEDLENELYEYQEDKLDLPKDLPPTEAHVNLQLARTLQ